MAIRIEPLQDTHLEAVRRFNQRLTAGGIAPEFLMGDQLHAGENEPNAPVRLVRYVAHDENEVRGGYLLHFREFEIAGQRHWLGDYNAPIAEGVIDKKFAATGAMLLRHATKENAHLYTVGMGGLETPLPRSLKGMGWSLTLVPFLFRVNRASVFLGEMRHLRQDARRRRAMDAVRFSGLGQIGWQLLETASRWKQGGRSAKPYRATPVPQFDEGVDQVWDQARSQLDIAAVRDRAALHGVYAGAWARRIQVTHQGQCAGWAVVVDRQMQDNKYFGNMRIGLIADLLAAPAHLAGVTRAAAEFTASLGVDLTIANTLHGPACQAFRQAGFFEGPSNYGVGFSKPAIALLPALDWTRVHIVRGDGDGLSNFIR